MFPLYYRLSATIYPIYSLTAPKATRFGLPGANQVGEAAEESDSNRIVQDRLA